MSGAMTYELDGLVYMACWDGPYFWIKVRACLTREFLLTAVSNDRNWNFQHLLTILWDLHETILIKIGIDLKINKVQFLNSNIEN